MKHHLEFPLGLCILLSLAVLLAAAPAAAQCQYEVTAVIQHPGCPPPFSSNSMTATAMNSHGHVCGYYQNCVTLRDEGFIWTAGTGLVTMVRPAGVIEMQVEDINDHGVACGTWVNTNVPGGYRGFVRWADGSYTELDTLSGAGWGMAHAINNNNVVVGERASTQSVAPRIAFAWSLIGGFSDLTLAHDSSAAFDISDLGMVIGRYPNSAGSAYIGFFFDGIAIWEIRPAHLSFTPRSINFSSQVGGATGIGGGFIWYSATDTYDFILPAPGDHTAGVTEINNLRHAILHSRNTSTSTSRSFLWIDGGYSNVQDLLPKGSTFTVRDPVGINDAGQLLIRANGGRALVLSPVDRPPADLTADCRVRVEDVLTLFEFWATANPAADINDDGMVDVFDLFEVLSNWDL